MTTLDVSPRLFPFNSTDCGLLDAVVLGDISLLSCVGTNGKNLLFGKLGVVSFLATLHRAVFNRICRIARRGIPAKIGKSVVHGVAIVMAAKHSIRPWAYKRTQNKGGDIRMLTPILLPKKGNAAFEVAMVCGDFGPASFGVPKVSKIRNLIKTLVFENWPPYFHTEHLHMVYAHVKDGFS